MANPDHLKLLRQGVGHWNAWRKDNPGIRPDLAEANLGWADLSAVDFTAASLRAVDLTGADLTLAHLTGANLSRADLNKANLSAASLSMADLTFANLTSADLTGANLDGTNFTSANFAWTKLNSVNLSRAAGLATVRHSGPTSIGIDTVYNSQGEIPQAFLQGVGVPDGFISYVRSLASQPIQFYSCFISYSSKDDGFTRRLHADLHAHGVRCWFAAEDLRIGDKILDCIDQTIRVHEKVMIVLSADSITSEWVETEVLTALEEERRRKKTVLFPVRLDDSVFNTDEAWAVQVRHRNIGDFRRWKDRHSYEVAFDRLLRDLRASEGPARHTHSPRWAVGFTVSC